MTEISTSEWQIHERAFRDEQQQQQQQNSFNRTITRDPRVILQPSTKTELPFFDKQKSG